MERRQGWRCQWERRNGDREELTLSIQTDFNQCTTRFDSAEDVRIVQDFGGGW